MASENSEGEVDAWTEFWKEQGPDSKCLRDASPDLRDTLTEHWRSFAASIPANACILDVGCGSGVVGKLLIEQREDVTVIGTDSAVIPASNDSRLRLRGSMMIEQTDFEDSSFDSVVSQFGIEYSDIERSATELARILRPAGRISFVVHHRDSSIVVPGAARRQALTNILGRDVKRAFVDGRAASFAKAVSIAMSGCPGDALLIEVARMLQARIGLPKASREDVWHRTKAALHMERVILRALESSAVAEDDMDGWLQPLRRHFEIASGVLSPRSIGVPIGWKIEGRLRSIGR